MVVYFKLGTFFAFGKIVLSVRRVSFERFAPEFLALVYVEGYIDEGGNSSDTPM